jgi:carboxyl-terminal processing protease
MIVVTMPLLFLVKARAKAVARRAALCFAGPLGLALAARLWAADPRTEAIPPASAPAGLDPFAELITLATKYATPMPLLPGPYDGGVASLTARMLTNTHYLRRPVDAEMSERFLRRYFDLLDPLHLHFVEPDLKEFEKSRDKLAELTMHRGDTSPANEMHARLIQRMDQRVQLVTGLLRTNQFDFTGDDRYTPNRRDAPWPKDLDEARTLWRQHLRYEYLQEKLNKQKPDQILKTLSGRYKRLLKSWGELDNEDVLQIYLTALAQAYDPHSDYMGKAQLDSFAISMKLSLFGIGALLRAEDDYCKIESLVPGGPAERSKKIKPNDRIIGVQQKGGEPVDVVGWKLIKVVELIRGPKGTEVTLTIIPSDAADPSERRTITLVRDEIKLEDQEAKAKILDLPGPEGKVSRVGIIDLPSFYADMDLGGPKSPDLAGANAPGAPKSTTADVARLLKKLTSEKVGGIILDLRHNPGGSLEEAIRLTGLFIREGPIVQVKEANGDIQVHSDPDDELRYDGPLVVLTGRFSASASEILAAAIQDHGRAPVVGDSSTHGKGTVQAIYELNRFGRFPKGSTPGALKVTIRKFYRPNGESTQLRGVIPDIVLPSVANYLDVGESAQDYALPWDTIPAAPDLKKLGRVQAVADELRRRTEVRQASDKDFAYLRDDIELFRKLQVDKSVSLNETQRLKEKEETDARAKSRKTERKARPDPGAKVYEITLKNADQPGLPPPVAKTNEPPAIATAAATAAATKADETDPKTAKETDAEPEEKAPAVDVSLEEAKRILLDLIELSTHPAKPAPAPITARR